MGGEKPRKAALCGQCDCVRRADSNEGAVADPADPAPPSYGAIFPVAHVIQNLLDSDRLSRRKSLRLQFPSSLQPWTQIEPKSSDCNSWIAISLVIHVNE